MGAIAQMRKIFKLIYLALLLAIITSTHVQAEISAWRLWFLQEDEVIEADGYFFVKKTKAVLAERLDLETRKITMHAKSDILLHQAYLNNQKDERLCGNASGNLKGFKIEKKEFSGGVLSLSFSVPIEGVEVDMSSLQPCQ